MLAPALSVGRFLTDPCAALPTGSRKQLGIGATGEKDLVEAKVGIQSCDWKDTDGPSGTYVAVTFWEGGPGLSAVYEKRGSSFDFVNRTDDIGGYPAVIVGGNGDAKIGICVLRVGVSDQQRVGIHIQARGGAHPSKTYAKPCKAAQLVAKQVVQTIKGAQ